MPLEIEVPSASRLLHAWEAGRGSTPARQALLVLAACCPGAPAGALAALPVGARNRLLVTAHLTLFSPVLDCVADCPRCGCLLEAQVPLAQLVGAEPSGTAEPVPLEADLVATGHRVRYRLPTAGDLADVVGTGADRDPDGRGVATALVRRCFLEVDGDPDDLPEDVVRAVAEALAAADPDAVLCVRLTCPDCGTASDLVLDPMAFLWADVDEWAWRLLGEVHELASGYGWDEATILAMTPARRGAYLSLLTADDGVPARVGAPVGPWR